MKQFIYSILFLFIPVLSFSQTVRFNRTYDNVYAPLFRNVLIVDSGYVGLGFDYYSGKIQILIQKTDTLGNVLWLKHYGDSIYDYYHGTRNSLIKNTDGGYSLAGSRDNDSIDMCTLFKFDSNFDTLWTRNYFVDTNFTVFYNHIQTADGGYAIVGCYDNTNNHDGDVLLVKTDSLGNMQWYKTYGTTGPYSNDYGFCIVSTPDGGYLIGGSSYGYGNKDAYIFKIDSAGNEEWHEHYGNPSYQEGAIYDMLQTIDSGYVFSYGEDVLTAGGIPNYKYHFIKLDKNYNLLWDKEYGPISPYSGVGSIIELPNSNLVATISDDKIIGLFKLSAGGDSIWKRYYYPPDYDSINNNGNGLLALKQTADGGFIMAGVAYPPQRMWLVKTDSCGCDTAGCECGGTAVESIPASLVKIKLYPNPARNELWVEYLTTPGNAPKSIDIYTLDGKRVFSKPVYAAYGIIKLDVSGIQSGNYIVKTGKYSKQITIVK